MTNLKRMDTCPQPDPENQPDLLAATAQIETIEMVRLATAVLSKGPDDLAAIAASNGLIRKRWLDAFARQKAAAERDARFWSAAMAHLATGTDPRLGD